MKSPILFKLRFSKISLSKTRHFFAFPSILNRVKSLSPSLSIDLITTTSPLLQLKSLRKKAFTLLESLLALFINSLTLLVLLLLIRNIPSVLESQSRDPLFDQHWLVNRIQYEMTNYKLEELSPVDIYLTPRNGLGKSYLYEKYSGKDGLMIRRRSTRGGHVVLLNNIDRLRFSYIQKGEKPIVQLELDKGKKKNRYWLFPTY